MIIHGEYLNGISFIMKPAGPGEDQVEDLSRLNEARRLTLRRRVDADSGELVWLEGGPR